MRLSTLLFTGLCLFLPAVAFAETQNEVAAAESAEMKSQVDAKIAALLSAPAGVFDVEYDNGQLVRLKIKGEKEVPTSMSGARGDRQAADSAKRNAQAAFSQFLNNNVTVVESETEGFLIQEKDGKESAEYLNASQRTVASLSNSFQRGLITIFEQIEGEGPNRKAVVILGWSKKLVRASEQAAEAMQPTPAASSPAKPAASGQNAQPVGNTNTQTRVGNVEEF